VSAGSAQSSERLLPDPGPTVAETLSGLPLCVPPWPSVGLGLGRGGNARGAIVVRRVVVRVAWGVDDPVVVTAYDVLVAGAWLTGAESSVATGVAVGSDGALDGALDGVEGVGVGLGSSGDSPEARNCSADPTEACVLPCRTTVLSAAATPPATSTPTTVSAITPPLRFIVASSPSTVRGPGTDLHPSCPRNVEDPPGVSSVQRSVRSVRAPDRHNGPVHILLVEDDAAHAASSLDGLTALGFTVDHVGSGASALAAVASPTPPEVVLLDLGLPDMDGQEVCRRIRATTDIPIIVVSARGDETDRVIALELGADDYLVKPFGMRELAARIRAVMRRTQAPASAPAPATAAVQEIGRLSIDRRAQRVHLDGEEIALTAKEFDVLAYLAEDPGAVRRRTEILEHVWEGHWYGATKTVDAHVAAIRKKLGDAAWIEAVRGVGFRLGSP
jgi:DNA-binding response OmpR family regulator